MRTLTTHALPGHKPSYHREIRWTWISSVLSHQKLSYHRQIRWTMTNHVLPHYDQSYHRQIRWTLTTRGLPHHEPSYHRQIRWTWTTHVSPRHATSRHRKRRKPTSSLNPAIQALSSSTSLSYCYSNYHDINFHQNNQHGSFNHIFCVIVININVLFNKIIMFIATISF